MEEVVFQAFSPCIFVCSHFRWLCICNILCDIFMTSQFDSDQPWLNQCFICPPCPFYLPIYSLVQFSKHWLKEKMLRVSLFGQLYIINYFSNLILQSIALFLHGNFPSFLSRSFNFRI